MLVPVPWEEAQQARSLLPTTSSANETFTHAPFVHALRKTAKLLPVSAIWVGLVFEEADSSPETALAVVEMGVM
jgi:hypothetical protein